MRGMGDERLKARKGPVKGHRERRGGVFAGIRPSYLILTLIAVLSVGLFVSDPTYGDTLRFIRPGIIVTVTATVCGYLGASLLGLILAGLLLLKLGERTVATFAVITALLISGSLFFFSRPALDFSLVGADEGALAVVTTTPGRAIARARGDPPRPFRSFPTPQAALAALEAGAVTAALLPASSLPGGVTESERFSLPSDGDRRNGLTLAVLGIVTGLLTFGSWTSREHPMTIFAELYVDLVRGIPMLVVLIYVGFVIAPALRDASAGTINLPNLVRGIFGLMLGYAAYLAEIFRAGIEAVPKGQSEAARSLGLSSTQTMRFVILPQAVKIVIPPLGNEFIAMLKDSSLLTLLSVTEITQLARQNQSRTFNTFETWNTAALLYLALTLAASSLLDKIERRTKRAER